MYVTKILLLLSRTQMSDCVLFVFFYTAAAALQRVAATETAAVMRVGAAAQTQFANLSCTLY